jgi:hypothetical protein
MAALSGYYPIQNEEIVQPFFVIATEDYEQIQASESCRTHQEYVQDWIKSEEFNDHSILQLLTDKVTCIYNYGLDSRNVAESKIRSFFTESQADSGPCELLPSYVIHHY